MANVRRSCRAITLGLPPAKVPDYMEAISIKMHHCEHYYDFKLYSPMFLDTSELAAAAVRRRFLKLIFSGKISVSRT